MRASIITLGCRVNHYESTAIAERLSELGFEIVGSEEKADVCIVNSCAVTSEAVRKSGQMLRRIRNKNPDAFIGIMGCASQLNPSKYAHTEGVNFVCGTRNKLMTVDAIKKWINDRDYKDCLFDKPCGEIENMSVSSFDRTRAYVKIQDGCENKCAYCIISKARGTVTVRNQESIVEEVKRLASVGCHEVVLTGIETAAYGAGLADLISEVASVSGISRVRLGSMDPSFLKKDFVDDVAAIKEFCPHIHISVQSGSSAVLARMRRKYNGGQLRDVLEYMREKIPGCNFSADIIVGFPGETDEEFAETVKLVRDIGFLHCHIFRFSRRPGTEADTMPDQVSPEISEKRLHILEEAAAEEKNRILNKIIADGRKLAVLSETCEDGFVTGHTDSFVECRVLADGFAKGRIIGFIPERAENGVLVGKETENDNE